MSFLARTYIVLAQKRITLSYLKEMSYPRAKGLGKKTEKMDMSSSSKKLTTMSLEFMWWSSFFGCSLSSTPSLQARTVNWRQNRSFLSLLPWELGSAAAHVVRLLGAYSQANAAAAAKFI